MYYKDYKRFSAIALASLMAIAANAQKENATSKSST